MKRFYLLLAITVTLAGFVACEEKPKTIPDKIKDGLDARPNEKIKDAGENIKEATKDAGGAVKDKLKQ